MKHKEKHPRWNHTRILNEEEPKPKPPKRKNGNTCRYCNGDGCMECDYRGVRQDSRTR